MAKCFSGSRNAAGRSLQILGLSQSAGCSSGLAPLPTPLAGCPAVSQGCQWQCSGAPGFQGRDDERHRTICFCLVELEGEGLAGGAMGDLADAPVCPLCQGQDPSPKHQKPEGLNTG